MAWRNLVIVSLILLLLVSCAGGQKANSSISYSGPANFTIKRGEKLPFAEISYLGVGPQGAEVLIAGQKALKQKGDSLDWEGFPLPEVELKVRTRIINFNSSALNSVGFFTINISKPLPVPAPPPKEATIKFTAPVAYRINKGEVVPGTTIRYGGKDTAGAKFEGLEGYPYRKTGDSLVYTGKLKEKVYLVLNVRVLHYDQDTVTLSGTAEIIFSK